MIGRKVMDSAVDCATNWVAWLAAILSCSVASASIQGPVLRATRADEAPIVDGSLQDRCWLNCSAAADFSMVEPNPGAPVTQRTLVYVCYDDERIYFGVALEEAKPDKMQAACNQRDGGVYMDDSFEIMLDTYCDRRNAYYFMTNLIGAKLDGRIIDEGRNVDETWDGHWETKARLVDGGWELEMAIPFGELNFSWADSLVWGINFWRIERPHWENTSWAPVQKWCQVSRYGTLMGVTIRPKIQRFELLPYVAGRYEEDSSEVAAGIDFQFDVTSDLVLNATFLPDFAQIEADPFRFNLSYQEGEELYFREKRPFFLEGGAILSTPLQLFYTRRMNEILAGGKLYGKVGSTELLALDVQTEDTDENFSVVRVKQELFGTPTLGLLATHKQGADNTSQAAGIDLNLPVTGPFLVTSQFARTRNTGLSGDEWAAHAGIEGETGNYGFGCSARRIGREFWADQGFIGTYDIGRQGAGGWGWGKFFKEKWWLQWVDGGVSLDVTQEIGGELTRRESEFWLNFVTRPKWRLGVTGEANFERYGELEYENRNLGLQIESNVGGMTGVFTSFSTGSLYDSDFRFFHIGFLVLPLPRLSVFPVFQSIRLGQGSWQWLTNTRISYQITDRVFFRVFLQAESGGDASPREHWYELEDAADLNANFLLGYELGPGRMLYLVYNHPHDFETGRGRNILVGKLTYSLRF